MFRKDRIWLKPIIGRVISFSLQLKQEAIHKAGGNLTVAFYPTHVIFASG